MRPPRKQRSDEEIRGNDGDVELLVLVAVGAIRRGKGIQDLWMLDGRPMTPMRLKTLAGEDLIFLPISGPPRIAPRGLAVLDDAGG